MNMNATATAKYQDLMSLMKARPAKTKTERNVYRYFTSCISFLTADTPLTRRLAMNSVHKNVALFWRWELTNGNVFNQFINQLSGDTLQACGMVNLVEALRQVHAHWNNEDSVTPLELPPLFVPGSLPSLPHHIVKTRKDRGYAKEDRGQFTATFLINYGARGNLHTLYDMYIHNMVDTPEWRAAIGAVMLDMRAYTNTNYRDEGVIKAVSLMHTINPKKVTSKTPRAILYWYAVTKIKVVTLDDGTVRIDRVHDTHLLATKDTDAWWDVKLNCRRKVPGTTRNVTKPPLAWYPDTARSTHLTALDALFAVGALTYEKALVGFNDWWSPSTNMAMPVMQPVPPETVQPSAMPKPPVAPEAEQLEPTELISDMPVSLYSFLCYMSYARYKEYLTKHNRSGEIVSYRRFKLNGSTVLAAIGKCYSEGNDVQKEAAEKLLADIGRVTYFSESSGTFACLFLDAIHTFKNQGSRSVIAKTPGIEFAKDVLIPAIREDLDKSKETTLADVFALDAYSQDHGRKLDQIQYKSKKPAEDVQEELGFEVPAEEEEEEQATELTQIDKLRVFASKVDAKEHALFEQGRKAELAALLQLDAEAESLIEDYPEVTTAKREYDHVIRELERLKLRAEELSKHDLDHSCWERQACTVIKYAEEMGMDLSNETGKDSGHEADQG